MRLLNNNKISDEILTVKDVSDNLKPSTSDGGIIGGTVPTTTSQSGYIKLTNGLIIQWGQVAKGSNLAKGTDYDFPIVTMPTAFTNSYSLNLTIKLGGTSGTGGVELSYVTDSSAPLQNFKARLYNRNGNTTLVTPVLNWIAIGY